MSVSSLVIEGLRLSVRLNLLHVVLSKKKQTNTHTHIHATVSIRDLNVIKSVDKHPGVTISDRLILLEVNLTINKNPYSVVERMSEPWVCPVVR